MAIMPPPRDWQRLFNVVAAEPWWLTLLRNPDLGSMTFFGVSI
jgi:hypothetical protein